ncbi:MAG TPA: sugar nucleotide-binding protein, partial [Spirochaetia bacterium]|nr:sugar nucleotide-binding protein [Spirochaetia bacterium]
GALAPLVVDVVKSESLAWGTYHLAGSGHASRYELALAIRSEAIACHLVSSEAAGEIVPVASSDFPTPAPRPGWSALSTEKFRKAFGRELPPWRESLRRYIQTRSAQSVE